MIEADLKHPFSLYVHVPFCTSKCSYCAFYSLPKNMWNMDVDAYAEIIVDEIRKLRSDGIDKFDTIYIGGGNPGVLKDSSIIKIITEAEKKEKSREVTVEMNPEELTKDRLSVLKPYVDRISIGIQSLNDKTLKILGRNSNLKENLKALDLLKNSEINFNADLITAVNATSLEENIKDIRDLAAFDPDHISFYCLSYEENTPLYSKREERREDDEYNALYYGWKELGSLGYEHYEISNFAKDGKYSRHNKNYWSLSQYIGLGPSAESSLGYSDLFSFRYDEKIQNYLSDRSFKFEKLSKEQAILEFIMVALRTNYGIDKNEFKLRFKVDFDSLFIDEINKLSPIYYKNNASSFYLTEEGFMILDQIVLRLSAAI